MENNENYLISLFNKYQLDDAATIIELDNKNRVPVASINLKEAKLDKLTILETTGIDEKYMISFAGVNIFFSYFRRIKA